MAFVSTRVVAWRVLFLLVLLNTALIFGLWIYDRITDPVGYNLDKLVYGMSFEDVKSILGDPDTASSSLVGRSWCIYPCRSAGNGKTITLFFDNGLLHDWSDKGTPPRSPNEHE